MEAASSGGTLEKVRLPYEYSKNGAIIIGDRTDVAVVEDAAPKFQKRERDTWNTRFDFLLALIGFSVGLGNVWRFPYLCYKHGGGAFLIPYLICVGIGGIPLLFLEIAIGQFMQKGGIRVWSIMPILEGIGYATTIIVFLLDCYYNVILAWTFYYLFASLTSELPWATCGHEWNTAQCSLLANVTANDTGLVDPATEYWERKVLGIHLSTGIDDVGPIKWDLCLCLLLAWIVVYMCIWKGIKTSGKVMYFTATSPYIFMFILLVRGCTLDGAIDGIKFYVVPDWKLMLNTEVWVAAGTQIFFSYSISLGTLTALGSYNKYKHNSYRDAYWFALVNSGTSVLSGFVIFSILGYMAQKLNVDVKDVVKGGPGLAFIAYPQAVAVMPLAPFWSFLFFFMIILLGLDSQFVGVEGLVTAISDIYTQDLKKGYRKQLFVLGICSVAFLIGLSMVTHGGMYVFQMFDHYSGSRVILLLAFFQLTGISWLYGVQKFYADLKSMLGFSINPYMGFSWLITAPTFCLVMFGFVLSRYKELTYDTYEYPSEAIGIAWFIALISISMIPIFAVWNLVIAYKKEGSLWRAIQFTITPQIPPRGLTDEELAQELSYGDADVIMGKSGFPDTSSGGAMEQLPTYEDVEALNKRRDNSNAIIQSTKL